MNVTNHKNFGIRIKIINMDVIACSLWRILEAVRMRESKTLTCIITEKHHGSMVRTGSILHPGCEFELCRRELTHGVSGHPTRIWVHALGFICISGEKVYLWVVPPLGD
ncbi:hypothetical protein DY000_02038104 [Brassica cretica]|uniref:Uncharacterized protein n=1 Tax=Brassica cretica TaxID=69181 RepID=A0ABQ7B660_BRACR|nr:hypothetical protein DY000_02038104 [Brassica cretica]